MQIGLCCPAGALALVLTAAALAAPDRRRRSCRFSSSVLALAAFAGPAQCSRVGSTRHRAAFSADGVLQGPWGLW